MRRHLGALFLVAAFGLLPTASSAQEDVVKGLYDNAILLLRQGRPDEALKDLERIYKSYPNSEYTDEALYRLGIYHLENKQFQAGLDSFNLLISTFGDRNMAPEAYYSIGEIYENIQFPGFDYEKADANFARVYNIYPRSDRVDDALLHSGLLRARLQELRNARTTLQRLVDEYPQSSLAPQAYYALGLVLSSLDEPIGALESLQRVIDDYDSKDYSLKALRVINNLYRTNVLVSKQGAAVYRPDSAFSSKKFKKVSALETDLEGNLYVATEDGVGIKVYGPDGSELAPLPNHKDVRAIFVDSSGEQYVVKKGSIGYGGQDHVMRKKTPKGLEPLENLKGVVRDAARTFFVLSSDVGNLVQFDKDENYVGEFPSFKLNDVQDLTIDVRGNLYVIDGKIEKVARFDSKGTSTGSLDKKGAGFALKELSKIAVDVAGTIYVLDAKEKKVYLFTPEMKLLYSFAPPGLSKPELMAVNPSGTLYIYDSKEGAIRKYI